MQELLENPLKIVIKAGKVSRLAVSAEAAEEHFLLHPALLEEHRNSCAETVVDVSGLIL